MSWFLKHFSGEFFVVIVLFFLFFSWMFLQSLFYMYIFYPFYLDSAFLCIFWITDINVESWETLLIKTISFTVILSIHSELIMSFSLFISCWSFAHGLLLCLERSVHMLFLLLRLEWVWIFPDMLPGSVPFRVWINVVDTDKNVNFLICSWICSC